MSETKLLEMTNITKAFASNVVLNGVNLSVDEGEVVAILGENGAGKSTLIKILGGIYKADSGEIRMHGTVKNITSAAIAEIAADAVKKSETPIGLHLDHGKSFEDVKACIDAGFTSIMIDASHLPFEENVKECRRAADYCHFYGIPVEAELGALRGKEEDIVNEAECKTDPDMVAEFVEKTGCDTLAVSVGNVHGLCLNPQIDIPLLEKINQISKVPLVLHGGSGIPKEVIWEAKKHGLIKINYGSDLRKEFVKTFGQAYEENHNEYDVIHLSIEAVEEVSRKAQELVTMINEH